MELNKLIPIVIMFTVVGLLLGIGITTFGKVQSANYYSISGYNDTVTIANYTAQALDWGNVSDVTIYNATTSKVSVLPSSCYTLNTTDGAFMYKNETLACDVLGATTFYAVYSYKDYDTETTTALNYVVDETGNIASDWVGLLVTIVVLGFILFLVMRTFRMPR